MLKVCVFVPGTFAIITENEHMPVGTITSIPVGHLNGFDVPDICDADEIEPEMSRLGLEIKYYGAIVRAENDYRAAIVSLAVEVPTLEAALALPGFVPFGDIIPPVPVPLTEFDLPH